MKIKMFLLAIISSLTLVACDAQNVPEDKAPENNQSQEQQKEEPKKDEAQINKEETNEEKEITEEEEQQEPQAEIKFNLYTLDINDYNKVIPFENSIVTLDSEKSLEDNLQELCNILKKEYFKGDVEIKVVSIDSDKIATINLINEEAWLKHFQGSAGGIITQGTIVETLLQNEYQGDWIKGLKIQVDGKEGQEYDHITFTDTFMRKSK